MSILLHHERFVGSGHSTSVAQDLQVGVKEERQPPFLPPSCQLVLATTLLILLLLSLAKALGVVDKHKAPARKNYRTRHSCLALACKEHLLAVLPERWRVQDSLLDEQLE